MLNTDREKGIILEETLADNEKQLQELIKDNPDLLPVEDLGMKGPCKESPSALDAIIGAWLDWLRSDTACGANCQIILAAAE